MIPKLFGRQVPSVENPFRIHQGHHRKRRLGERVFCLIGVASLCAIFITVYGSINLTPCKDARCRYKPSMNGIEKPNVMYGLKLPSLKKIFKAKTKEQREDLKRQRTEFKRLVNKLKPCRLDSDCGLEKGHRVLIRNVIPEDRHWCGKEIQGNGGTVIFDDYPVSCSNNSSYLFSSSPPDITGRGMSPIELYWDYSGAASDSTEESNTIPFDCSIPCRTNGNGHQWNILSIISVRCVAKVVCLSPVRMNPKPLRTASFDH